MSDYKRLKEKLETILTLPELPFEEDLTAVDCKQMYDILCKIERGALVDTETYFIVEENQWAGKNRFLVCQNAVQLAVCDFCENLEEAEKRLKELQE